MPETIETTVLGVRLTLMSPHFGVPDGADLWSPSDYDWDGPSEPAPIGKWPEIIHKWRIAKQVEAGFEVWDISHSDPKFWHKRPAVFRRGTPTGDTRYQYGTHYVVTRNFAGDADSLYSLKRGDTAQDTPEVAAAIEAAKIAHAEARKAAEAWKRAKNAIPVLPEDEWMNLPERPE